MVAASASASLASAKDAALPFRPGVERSGGYGFAHVGHERHVAVDVVDGQQPDAQYLPDIEEVADIGAAEVAASVAAATFLDGGGVALEFASLGV